MLEVYAHSDALIAGLRAVLKAMLFMNKKMQCYFLNKRATCNIHVLIRQCRFKCFVLNMYIEEHYIQLNMV